MRDLRVEWQENENATLEAEREAAAAAGRAVVDIEPIEFYSALTMERVLNEVMQQILPEYALSNQLDYLKGTKKPQKVTARHGRIV